MQKTNIGFVCFKAMIISWQKNNQNKLERKHWVVQHEQSEDTESVRSGPGFERKRKTSYRKKGWELYSISIHFVWLIIGGQ